MAYHVNDEGVAGKCGATKGKCPFGGEHQHYGSAEDAQKAYELSMATSTLAAPMSKTGAAQVSAAALVADYDKSVKAYRDHFAKAPGSNGAPASAEDRKAWVAKLQDLRKARDESLKLIEDRGEGHLVPDDGKVIRVQNRAQKVLFEEEISGQLSDGHWENSGPRDHWKDWSDATVIVDPKNVGRNFRAMKDNYQLNSSVLLDAVGDRMVESVREAGIKDYDEARMRKDLASLRKVFKQPRVLHTPDCIAEKSKAEALQAKPAAAKPAAKASTSSAKASGSSSAGKSTYGTGLADHSDKAVVKVALAGPGADKPQTNFFGNHSGMANPINGDGDPYDHISSGGAVILAKRDGSRARVMAKGSELYSDPSSELGREATVYKARSNGPAASTDELYVMGYVDAQGNKHGWVPDRKLQYFVLK